MHITSFLELGQVNASRMGVRLSSHRPEQIEPVASSKPPSSLRFGSHVQKRLEPCSENSSRQKETSKLVIVC